MTKDCNYHEAILHNCILGWRGGYLPLYFAVGRGGRDFGTHAEVDSQGKRRGGVVELPDRNRLKMWYNMRAFSEEDVGPRNRAGGPSGMMRI